MIIPPPGPVYTLAPDIEGIDDEERAVLDRCLSTFVGRSEGFVVTRIGRTDEHFVVDLETVEGPVLVLERRQATDAIADERMVRRAR